MLPKIVIRGGKVVNSHCVLDSDALIEGDRILEVGSNLDRRPTTEDISTTDLTECRDGKSD